MLKKVKNVLSNFEFIVPAVMLTFVVVFLIDIQRLPAAARRMPTIIGVISVGLIVTLMITQYKQIFCIKKEEDSGEEAPKKGISAANKKVLIISAIMILYVLGIIYIGYFVATFVMIVATALILGERNYLAIVLTPLVYCLFTYLVFVQYFSLRLPSGILF